MKNAGVQRIANNDKNGRENNGLEKWSNHKVAEVNRDARYCQQKSKRCSVFGHKLERLGYY
jgi:hypothetical protein